MEPPTASHILRYHTAAVTAIHISDDRKRITSGDASGKVVVTSTRSLRAITLWSPHSDGLLGVQEWDKHIITYVPKSSLALPDYR